MDCLKVYNEEFTTWDDLKNITTQFREDINKEYSQGCEDIPIELFQKEKEYLLPLPDINKEYSQDCKYIMKIFHEI